MMSPRTVDMRQRQFQNCGIFSAQLWKAVGLQQQQLNISRDLFLPDDASRLPSSSLPSSRETGARRYADAGQLECLPSADDQKRRRGTGYYASCRESADIFSSVWQEPDLHAIEHAPRRPRTDRKRRPTVNVQKLAAEFSLYEEGDDMDAAFVEVQQTCATRGEPCAQPAAVTSRPQDSVCVQPAICCVDATVKEVIGKQQPSEQICGRAGRPEGSPASTESSQGVFGGSASPCHDIGSESSKQHSWQLGSPLTDD